jgi:hypothetical protein
MLIDLSQTGQQAARFQIAHTERRHVFQMEQSDHRDDVIRHLLMPHPPRSRRRTRRSRTAEPESDHGTGIANLSCDSMALMQGCLTRDAPNSCTLSTCNRRPKVRIVAASCMRHKITISLYSKFPTPTSWFCPQLLERSEKSTYALPLQCHLLQLQARVKTFLVFFSELRYAYVLLGLAGQLGHQYTTGLYLLDCAW